MTIEFSEPSQCDFGLLPLRGAEGRVFVSFLPLEWETCTSWTWWKAGEIGLIRVESFSRGHQMPTSLSVSAGVPLQSECAAQASLPGSVPRRDGRCQATIFFSSPVVSNSCSFFPHFRILLYMTTLLFYFQVS